LTAKKLENRQSQEFTRFERARLIGSRALQLSQGAPFLKKFTKKELEKINYDPIEIAKIEFAAGIIPIEIKRILPHE
jgi:DNA-directed RNA polymerase subunit K